MQDAHEFELGHTEIFMDAPFNSHGQVYYSDRKKNKDERRTGGNGIANATNREVVLYTVETYSLRGFGVQAKAKRQEVSYSKLPFQEKEVTRPHAGF
jgi:hypothetical protein